MALVHPDMVERLCDTCGHKIGVYPSGQAVLAQHSEHDLTLVCQVCQPPGANAIVTPDALEEAQRSVRRSQTRWRDR